eukprot:CCRYP_017055-RC/>CCRYP_017055-RC protein AED:0.08 eAED:0.08 QI:315/1/1/1/0.25/0/5/745/242
MPPSTPRSAYHLYFRFYKNVLLYPSLRMDPIRDGEKDRELYKRYVQTVLNANTDDLAIEENGGQQRYIGNVSFVVMSKKVSKKWREVDELTRSVFKELAKEDGERYKKELFDSYQIFAKNNSVALPASMPTLKVDHCGQIQRNTSSTTFQTKSQAVNGSKGSPGERTNQVRDQGTKTNKSRQIRSHITEVDMTDEEIISVAIEVWDTSSTTTDLSCENLANDFAGDKDLHDFLSGIDWSTAH